MDLKTFHRTNRGVSARAMQNTTPKLPGINEGCNNRDCWAKPTAIPNNKGPILAQGEGRTRSETPAAH